MKNLAIKAAVLAAVGFMTTQATADWETLPASGVEVSPGSFSPYILCNTTGDYGSGITTKPTSNSDACARILTSETQVPDPSYTTWSALPIASATRTITMNNTYTNFSNVNVGTLRELVWRKSTGISTYECIYGMKVSLSPYPHTWFTPTDVARAGFSGLDLQVAYSTYGTLSSPTYRIGRTFTSVQYNGLGSSLPQPLTTPPFNLSINAGQSASLNDNWVDFRARLNWPDNIDTGWLYVKTSCTSAPPQAVTNAIRVRQAVSPFMEASVTGFVPAGGVATPAPVSPY